MIRPHLSVEHASHLPTPFASFVGRERQIEELRRLVASHRLVTLTGAPGVGKTRLAVQVANQLRTAYPDGVWMVELAQLDEPALVASAVARALGVREADRTPTDALVDELRDCELLLALDNCEHVLDACAALAETLLTTCAGVRVVATSRQALGLTGEFVWRVPPLSVPGPTESGPGPVRDARAPAAGRSGRDRLSDLIESEAGRLFIERARAARDSFEVTEADAAAVEEICRRVDGIPLAIELAAARIAHLAPRQIADRLDDRFRLLARGRSSHLPRHDTLRSLVDWSHDLLSDAERVAFRRVAVFAGGWTLEAAEAICGKGTLDVLGQLVDKSLVLVEEQPAALRYHLHETIRDYALERLGESGEAFEVRRLHAEHYLAVAEDAAPRLFGPDLQPLLEALDREHDNVRLALRWATESEDDEVGLRMAGALWRFWQVRGNLREGRSWLERLLAIARPVEPTDGRARALHAIGFLAFLQGDYDTAHTLLAESVAMRRALDDGHGLVEALTNLGVLLRCLGEDAPARQALEEALDLTRALGDRAWEGRILNKRARLAFYQGDLATARTLHEEGIALVRLAGNAWDVAIALGDLADVSHALGDDATARRHYAESLGLWLELGDERGIAQGLEGFAILAMAVSQPERAVRLLGAAHAIRERITEPSSPGRRADLERILQVARADLGKRFDAIWAVGYAAAPEEVVEEALTDPPAGAAAQGAQPLRAVSVRRTVTSAGRASASSVAPGQLTERERDVVALIARGLTNREIAAALVVSSRTVEWHVGNVLGRLGLHSRAQLALWARGHLSTPFD